MQPNHDKDAWLLTLVLTKTKLRCPKTESYGFPLELAMQGRAAKVPSDFVHSDDLEHEGSYCMHTDRVQRFQFVLVIDSFGFVVILHGLDAGKALTYSYFLHYSTISTLGFLSLSLSLSLPLSLTTWQ